MVAIGLLYSTLLTSPRESGIGFGIILIGVAVLFLLETHAAVKDPSGPVTVRGKTGRKSCFCSVLQNKTLEIPLKQY